MSRVVVASSAVILFAVVGPRLHAVPSVYPTGTTIYDPDRAWSGYTIHDTPNQGGAVLVDMNGTVVKRWPEIVGFPPRILPGGFIMGSIQPRQPYQENNALVQLDWNGTEVWRFDGTERVETADGEPLWSARQHHDWHREGSPAGYFAPGAEPRTDGGRTLLLTHRNVTVPGISDKRLEDDYLLEVSWDGDVLWDWLASDHVDDFGFSDDARNAIYRASGYNEARDSFDWLHINSASYVGPNRWYDAGDGRFHPDNVIISAREANVIAIVSRAGKIVWRLGPDYRATPEQREIGQVIGQHHPHIIPAGLPGAGNLLVFDNGGQGGYGPGNPAAPGGVQLVTRASSRVLEIDPVTLEVVWQYSMGMGAERFRFFSWYVSSAQRLPNGNTLINEGADGRIFEITTDGEIVWEYVNPFPGDEPNGTTSRIYRAYRVPYDWIPQIAPPVERRVTPPDNAEFRIEPE